MVIDKITLSVIQAGLQQVCDEMDLSFSRAAFSPVISEANDRSDGIYAADNGDLIAQGVGGLPVFVGTMEYSTRELIRLIDEGKVDQPNEKDIIIFSGLARHSVPPCQVNNRIVIAGNIGVM